MRINLHEWYNSPKNFSAFRYDPMRVNEAHVGNEFAIQAEINHKVKIEEKRILCRNLTFVSALSYETTLFCFL